MSDEVDATKVDVDPDLFGELPEGPIEDVDEDEYGEFFRPEIEKEFDREVMIVATYGFCVECDGTIEKSEHTAPGGDRMVRYTCQDCGEGWVSNRSEDYSTRL